MSWHLTPQHDTPWHTNFQDYNASLSVAITRHPVLIILWSLVRAQHGLPTPNGRSRRGVFTARLRVLAGRNARAVPRSGRLARRTWHSLKRAAVCHCRGVRQRQRTGQVRPGLRGRPGDGDAPGPLRSAQTRWLEPCPDFRAGRRARETPAWKFRQCRSAGPALRNCLARRARIRHRCSAMAVVRRASGPATCAPRFRRSGRVACAPWSAAAPSGRCRRDR